MLIESSSKVAIHNELLSIHHSLSERFNHLESTPAALTLIEDMLNDSHPSGLPEPDALSWAAYYLRKEKFKAVRETEGPSALAADIQTLITRLKCLKQQAELARPATTISVTRGRWRDRAWCDISYFIPVFPFLIIVITAITLAITLIFDISGTSRFITVGAMMAFLFTLAITAKDIACIHLLITLSVCLAVAYDILIWIPKHQ